MAGIMPTAGLEKESAPPEADPETVGDEEGWEQAGPEEQAAYEEIVLAGMEIIYEGGEFKPGIAELLDNDPADLREALGDTELLADFGPVVALGAAAAIVVLQIVRESEEKYPDDALMHAGKKILEELAGVADVAGIRDYSQEEMNRAWFVGLDIYREAATEEGLIDPAQLAAEFEEFRAADAQVNAQGGQDGVRG